MNLNAVIQAATQTLIDHVDELTALDQAIGDGDHGLNMRRGALAIQGKLEALSAQTLNEALRTMGMTCMSTIGGSSGSPVVNAAGEIVGANFDSTVLTQRNAYGYDINVNRSVIVTTGAGVVGVPGRRGHPGDDRYPRLGHCGAAEA